MERHADLFTACLSIALIRYDTDSDPIPQQCG